MNKHSIRDMLRRHQALSLVRQTKAVCWWCHQHTMDPEPDAWLTANAVTDGQIKALYREAWEHSPLGAWQTTGTPMRYGTGIDWDEFHTPTEYHGTPDRPTTRHTIWPITLIIIVSMLDGIKAPFPILFSF